MGFPAAGFFTGNPTWGEGLQGLDDVVARARQQIGADGVDDETIASGAIVPTTGSVRLFGQGGAADTLSTIDPVNFEDGQLLELRIGDENQPITVAHAASPAAGEIQLSGGMALGVNDLSQRLVLQLDGTVWREWARFGREKVHAVDDPGEPGFEGTWGAGFIAPRFWKTGDSQVTLSGVGVRPSSGVSEIFQLPVGYRPLNPVSVPVFLDVGGAPLVGTVDVQADGFVLLAFVPGGAGSAAVAVDLSAVSFRADQ